MAERRTNAPPHCHIVPPHILRALAENGAERIRNCAWSTLTDSEQARGQRRILMPIVSMTAVPTGTKRRTIYDALHSYELPGRLVRVEGSRRSRDRAANEA